MIGNFFSYLPHFLSHLFYNVCNVICYLHHLFNFVYTSNLKAKYIGFHNSFTACEFLLRIDKSSLSIPYLLSTVMPPICFYKRVELLILAFPEPNPSC
jgi:hypothetical protein